MSVSLGSMILGHTRELGSRTKLRGSDLLMNPKFFSL